jgi:hypothetical protein
MGTRSWSTQWGQPYFVRGDGGIRTLTGGGLSALPLPIGLRPPVLLRLVVCGLAIIRPPAALPGC